jgi:cytochrome c biogenesis protein CcmG/thiol:disulfide interchange protein DsbE
VLTAAARELEGRVRFVGVIYEDSEDNVREFSRKHGKAYPSLLDEAGRTAIAYGIFGVPETYFLDASGTIVAKHVGPLDEASLAAQLRKAGLKP